MKVRLKFILLLQVSSHDFEPILLFYFVWTEEYCQTSPNKNKSPNLWHVTSILVCCIFDWRCKVPSTCLGLALYTYWVNYWSKAMDFLQTLLQTNIFSDRHDKKHLFSSKDWRKSIASLQLLTQDVKPANQRHVAPSGDLKSFV